MHSPACRCSEHADHAQAGGGSTPWHERRVLMTTHGVREPDAKLRALAGRDGGVRLVARDLTFASQYGSSLDPSATRPGALDLLLGALATDLLAGFARHARREGVTVHDCEVRLEARLDNPLVALGVVGEGGSPALSTVGGAFYVSCDADAEALASLWRTTLEQSAVHATLARSATLGIVLVPQA